MLKPDIKPDDRVACIEPDTSPDDFKLAAEASRINQTKGLGAPGRNSR
jgi:hypothetical protein